MKNLTNLTKKFFEFRPSDLKDVVQIFFFQIPFYARQKAEALFIIPCVSLMWESLFYY